jgi:hypothetical protein
MPVSSIGYYRVFAVNMRDSHIFILDPMTTGIIHKEERMKQYGFITFKLQNNFLL